MSPKLRQRLTVLAALSEPVLLDRLGKLPRRDLLAFHRLFGICRCLPAAAAGQRHEPGRESPDPRERRVPVAKQCRCRRSVRAQRLSLRVHVALLAMLWPADYGEPPPADEPTPAKTTEQKSWDLAERARHHVALFHRDDLLQSDTFEMEGLYLKALRDRVMNGYDVRAEWSAGIGKAA